MLKVFGNLTHTRTEGERGREDLSLLLGWGRGQQASHRIVVYDALILRYQQTANCRRRRRLRQRCCLCCCCYWMTSACQPNKFLIGMIKYVRAPLSLSLCVCVCVRVRICKLDSKMIPGAYDARGCAIFFFFYCILFCVLMGRVCVRLCVCLCVQESCY